MRISVVGMGVVGLPLALSIAKGSIDEVDGVDINRSLIASLQMGITPQKLLKEPSIPKLLSSCEIRFSCEYRDSDMIFVCVQTPVRDGKPCIQHVLDAVAEAVQHVNDYGVIVIVSTMPPGTVEGAVKPLLPRGKKLSVVYSPERLLPGNIIQELATLDMVIGADSMEAFHAVAEVYDTFNSGKKLFCKVPEAELIKIFENSHRAVNIALANEMAKICHANGVSFHRMREIINTHPRVKALAPGVGVGGDCIPTDPKFLQDSCAEIIHLAARQNDMQPDYVFRRVKQSMGRPDGRILILGAAFKANVAEITNSPSLALARIFRENSCAIVEVYDPLVAEYNSMAGGRFDVVVVTVAHKSFGDFTWLDRITGRVFDCTGAVNPGNGLSVEYL